MLHSSYNNEHCRKIPLKLLDGNKLRVSSDFYHLLDDRFYLLGSDRSVGRKFYQKHHLYFHRMGHHIFIFDHKGLPEKKEGRTMITKNSVVSLSYNLKNSTGEELDKADAGQPFAYLHGMGQIIPGLEKEL